MQSMGLPTGRDEYWKYTDPVSLTQTTASRAALYDPGDESPVYSGIDQLRIVFVDGIFVWI